MHQDQDDSLGIELNAKKEAVYTILNEQSRSLINQRGSDPQDLNWLSTDLECSDPLYDIQLVGTILHE